MKSQIEELQKNETINDLKKINNFSIAKDDKIKKQLKAIDGAKKALASNNKIMLNLTWFFSYFILKYYYNIMELIIFTIVLLIILLILILRNKNVKENFESSKSKNITKSKIYNILPAFDKSF